MKRTANLLLVFTVLFSYFSIASAAMFQQLNQDAAGLGDAQAGNAADADDASTEFYNPAGLIRIHQQQVVFGTNLYMPTLKFDGSSTTGGVTNSADAWGGEFYHLPFLHYAAPISDAWAFGFGITSPYKMQTNWGANSGVSPNATNTELLTYDISTDLAYAPTKKFSFGLGLDFVKVIISNYNFYTPTGSNYQSNLGGRQWNQTWHGGVLYQFNPETRVGLAYHSQVDYSASGGANTADTSGNTLQSTNAFSLNGILPAYTSLSVHHQLGDSLVLEEGLIFTHWHAFDEVSYENLPTGSGETTAVESYNFNNTWRFALGVHYVLSDTVLLRGGAAYETSPYKDNVVYLQAPQGAGYDVSIGLHVQQSEMLFYDFGWTHSFYKDQKISSTNSLNSSTTTGEFEGDNDVLGAQLVWNMT